MLMIIPTYISASLWPCLNSWIFWRTRWERQQKNCGIKMEIRQIPIRWRPFMSSYICRYPWNLLPFIFPTHICTTFYLGLCCTKSHGGIIRSWETHYTLSCREQPSWLIIKCCHQMLPKRPSAPITHPPQWKGLRFPSPTGREEG